MPFTYLIDGYNLIHALGLVRKQPLPKDLEIARRRLLDFLDQRLESDAALTVVFDGKRKPSHVPDEQNVGRILVRYAGRNEEADDLIERMIAAHSSPGRLVVISNDRRLRTAATRRRAQSWGCAEMLDHEGRPSVSGPTPAEAIGEPRLSRTEVQEWLREFEGVELPNEFKDFLDPPPPSE